MVRFTSVVVYAIFVLCTKNDSLFDKTQCTCYSSSQSSTWTIDCHNRDLYVLPAQPCSQAIKPGSVTRFSFFSNNIRRVPFNYFRQYTSLARLLLQDTLILNLYFLPQSLESFHFSKKYTEHSQCGIKSLTGFFNSTLPHVRDIDWCEDSCISAVLREDFLNLPSLTTLNIARNNISDIENEAFYNLPRLRNLYLEGNKMHVIRSQMFKGLFNLSLLNLDHNSLRNLDADFLNFSMLTSLYLSHNQIVSIDSNAFRQLGNLQYLYLGNNPLSSIGAGAFQRLPYLKSL